MAKEKINNVNEGLGELNTEIVVQGMASISKAVKDSAVTISGNEARFLVDTYYQMQGARIAADGQIRSIVQSADDQDERIPLALKWVSANMKNQEVQLKKMLESYVGSLPVGRWAMATKGIGPILAAGCLSYFDINKVNHYGQFWSFCGLNDYNNPWLGKEGAAELVKRIYEELEESDEEVRDEIGQYLCDPDDYKEFFAPLSELDNYGMGEVIDHCTDRKSKKMYKELMNYFDTEDADYVEDFIIRNYVSPKAVTERVIMRVYEETTRKRDIIIKGLQNVVTSKKKKEGEDKPKKRGKKAKPNVVAYTRSDLASYLAKPPYNKNAKQLVYLIGEQFVKVSGKPDSLYGKLYRERRAYEEANNNAGLYADLAEEALEKKGYAKNKTTESYKAYIEGRLPKTQIHRRSKRYAVKIFISHLFEAMYMDKHGCKVPYEIYPIAHMEHTDYIGPEIPFEKYIDIK